MCDAYAAALSGVDAGRAQLHPAGNSERWSMQQVVEHLVLTYRSSSESLRKRLEKDQPTRARVTLGHRLARGVVLGVGYFPYGRPAPEHVRPVPGVLPACSGSELVTHLGAGLAEMDGLLTRCQERFGSKRMASHFALGPLSAAQWRAFHVIHGRHHLKQVRGIQQSLGMAEKR